jgi:hypothetical protein
MLLSTATSQVRGLIISLLLILLSVSVTFVCTNALFVRSRGKLALRSDGGDFCTKKWKWEYGGSHHEVSSQAVVFVFNFWQEFWFRMFSHLIYSLKKYYKCCIFNAICIDDAAVNYITLQHENHLFPSSSTGHTALVKNAINIVQCLYF